MRAARAAAREGTSCPCPMPCALRMTAPASRCTACSALTLSSQCFSQNPSSSLSFFTPTGGGLQADVWPLLVHARAVLCTRPQKVSGAASACLPACRVCLRLSAPAVHLPAWLVLAVSQRAPKADEAAAAPCRLLTVTITQAAAAACCSDAVGSAAAGHSVSGLHASQVSFRLLLLAARQSSRWARRSASATAAPSTRSAPAPTSCTFWSRPPGLRQAGGAADGGPGLLGCGQRGCLGCWPRQRLQAALSGVALPAQGKWGVADRGPGLLGCSSGGCMRLLLALAGPVSCTFWVCPLGSRLAGRLAWAAPSPNNLAAAG